VYAARASPRTPLQGGKLRELPDPLAVLGSRFTTGEGRKGEGEGRKEEKRRGSVPPLLLQQ